MSTTYKITGSDARRLAQRKNLTVCEQGGKTHGYLISVKIESDLLLKVGAAVAAAITHINARLSAPIPTAPVDPVKAEKARLSAEWDAAVQAGSIWMTVHDEDGGTSRVCRPPRGWTHEGCETLGHYLRLKCPSYAAAQDSAHNAAVADFRAWWSSAQGRPLEEQRAGWDRLSRAAKLCAVGVVPKSLRRLLS